jgi:autotransporter translocation and assembly factor TamB
LKALALDLTLNGQSAVISGSGLLGGGKVELKGQVLAHPQLRVELAVSGDHHQILVPPSSEILVSEELTLVLTQGLLDVRGEVRVHEGVLRHKELPVGSVGLSREVVIVDTLGNVIENESPFAVSVDIWLRIRDSFRVEGEGVRATLGGELHVTQVPGEEPQVFGSLNVIAGELEAYRQRLQVRRGRIAFTGPSDNPELDIMAEREIRADDVTVGARLQGRLDEPVLEVYSNPPMPQGETMSYLVRGRGLDSGADADGTALALSVGADVVNRSGIVAELNRLPLLSDVSFGASGGEDDTAATVSGYIGNRLYLAYGRGIYEPINELTARLYLQSRLWLEVVSRLESSVDLYYSFDID